MSKQTKKYYLSNGELYSEETNNFFSFSKKIEIEKRNTEPKWLGSKIPWNLWRELVLWCEMTQEKFGSEALAFLMYDEVKKLWTIWYPPQTSKGMTVKSDPENPLYKEQRKVYGDMLMLGSLHHHCKMAAFQSGTDNSDEHDFDGLHFTVGSLDKKEYTVDARLCINKSCYKVKPSTLIEPPADLANLTCVSESHKQEIFEKALCTPIKEKDSVLTSNLNKIMKLVIHKQSSSRIDHGIIVPRTDTTYQQNWLNPVFKEDEDFGFRFGSLDQLNKEDYLSTMEYAVSELRKIETDATLANDIEDVIELAFSNYTNTKAYEEITDNYKKYKSREYAILVNVTSQMYPFLRNGNYKNIPYSIRAARELAKYLMEEIFNIKASVNSSEIDGVFLCDVFKTVLDERSDI